LLAITCNEQSDLAGRFAIGGSGGSYVAALGEATIQSVEVGRSSGSLRVSEEFDETFAEPARKAGAGVGLDGVVQQFVPER
jgi:hypothetical protein